MLPPYELEKREFKKSVKGYNISDVDEHMEFVIDKYTELYRAYNELEQKLSDASAELETYKRNEDAIRRALVYAQNTKKKIIDDANRRSDMILKSAKDNCDKIINDFKEQVKEERSTLAMLKAQVEEFKQRIFAQYQRHIEYLEEISPENDTRAEWILPESEYTSKVLAQVVLDVENAEAEKPEEAAEEDMAENTDIASFDSTLDTLIADRTVFDVPYAGEMSDDYDEPSAEGADGLSTTEDAAGETSVEGTNGVPSADVGEELSGSETNVFDTKSAELSGSETNVFDTKSAELSDRKPDVTETNGTEQSGSETNVFDTNGSEIQMDRNAVLDALFTSQRTVEIPEDGDGANDGVDPGAETRKFEINK